MGMSSEPREQQKIAFGGPGGVVLGGGVGARCACADLYGISFEVNPHKRGTSVEVYLNSTLTLAPRITLTLRTMPMPADEPRRRRRRGSLGSLEATPHEPLLDVAARTTP